MPPLLMRKTGKESLPSSIAGGNQAEEDWQLSCKQQCLTQYIIEPQIKTNLPNQILAVYFFQITLMTPYLLASPFYTK